MQTKFEREDFLAEIMMEITESKSATKKQIESGIYVDPNHQLSEDAKFGYELAKNPIAWNNYFNNK